MSNAFKRALHVLAAVLLAGTSSVFAAGDVALINHLAET